MKYFFYILIGILSILSIILLYMYLPLKTVDDNATIKPKNDVLVLKLAHNSPTTSALHEASKLFAQEVYKKSKGKLKIEIYPAQKLGNDYTMMELAREGKIDILLTPTAKMSLAIPSMQYADLPFFFPTKEDLYAMLDSEPGQILLEKLKKIGLVGVTFWENGFKDFSANSPILSPDDLKGRKMRIMKSRIIQEQFKDLGAEPIVIDFYSTKKALEDKAVDGQENPLIAFYGMGFYKVQSDLTLSKHAYLGYVFSISSKVFDKLSRKERDILIDTAKKVTPWERMKTAEKEQDILKKIEDFGVKVHTLTSKEREEFANKTSNIADKYEDVIGSDLISKTQELLLERHPRKDILTIGIDTDLSVEEYNGGLAIKRGAQLAVDQINENGGLLGKKLVLIAKDNRVLSSRGVENIEDMLKRKDLIAVLGGKHSSVVIDEIKLMQNAHKPFIIPWASNSRIVNNGYKEDYVFSTSANNRTSSEFIAKKAAQKYKNIAIFAENNIFGREGLKIVKKNISKKQLKPSNIFTFNRGQKNFNAEADKIDKDKVDAVILISNSIEGAKIIKAVYTKNKKIAIYSQWSILGGDFLTNKRESMPNLNLHIFQTFSFSHNKNVVSENLRNSYIKKYAKTNDDKIIAQNAVAQAYDAVIFLAKAVKEANSTDGTKIKKALEKLHDIQGAIKYYKHVFSEQDHYSLKYSDYFMKQYTENRQYEK